MIGILNDISILKQREQELKNKNLTLKAILEALPGTLNVVDSEYNISWK